MLGETQNQFSFTRVALSTGGREKTNFLSVRAPTLPDYVARRRRIFGDKVLPNMVLLSRSEEPW